jgi:predicted Zn-dependent protease with MMP-like domain
VTDSSNAEAVFDRLVSDALDAFPDDIAELMTNVGRY